MDILVQKTKYFVPEITTQEVEDIKHAMDHAVQLISDFASNDNSIEERLVSMKCDEIKEIIDALKAGRIANKDRFVEWLVKSMYGEIEILENGLSTIKNMLLSTYSEFGVLYVKNYNKETASESMVCHKSFQKACETALEKANERELQAKMKKHADDVMNAYIDEQKRVERESAAKFAGAATMQTD